MQLVKLEFLQNYLLHLGVCEVGRIVGVVAWVTWAVYALDRRMVAVGHA